jgi:hypothetical protein
MQAAKHSAESDPIANQVLIVSAILRMLAITGAGARHDRRLALLAREAADLRALVGSGADTDTMRSRAAHGIATAEESVREQTREALRMGAKRSWSLAITAPLRLARKRSRARATADAGEDALLRARSQELLTTLAKLRRDLGYATAPAAVSSSRHAQPASRAAMGPQLASEEAR